MKNTAATHIQQQQDDIFKKMSPLERIQATGEFSQFVNKLSLLHKEKRI